MRHDIIEYAEISPAIGRTVTVTVDRPLGSYHPEHKDMYYPINYGYVEGIMAPDGEEQDAKCNTNIVTGTLQVSP